jgi:hypothetical protein
MVKPFHFDKSFDIMTIHPRDQMSHNLPHPSQFKDPLHNLFDPMGVFPIGVEENDLIFEFFPLPFFPVIREKSINPWIGKTQFE